MGIPQDDEIWRTLRLLQEGGMAVEKLEKLVLVNVREREARRESW